MSCSHSDFAGRLLEVYQVVVVTLTHIDRFDSSLYLCRNHHHHIHHRKLLVGVVAHPHPAAVMPKPGSEVTTAPSSDTVPFPTLIN